MTKLTIKDIEPIATYINWYVLILAIAEELARS